MFDYLDAPRLKLDNDDPSLMDKSVRWENNQWVPA